MPDVSPLSPEQRARSGQHRPYVPQRLARRLIPGQHTLEIAKRVGLGVFTNGFMYAGNLAYLSLMTVFPFFITAAAIASVLGQSRETTRAVASFLHTLPHDVATLLEKPITDVLAARTGSLLWFGGLVGLWTVASFMETLRDIFRRAYGVTFTKPFWHYRLSSMLVIVGSVIIALLSFLVQGLMTAVEQFIYHLLPWAEDAAGWIGLSRLIPGAIMFLALYVLFYSITPSKYRLSKSPKWPGAFFTTLWWVLATAVLPLILSRLGGYDLTYGSLAGVVVTLLFFYIIGLGVVVGAHLNAALAEPLAAGVEGAGTGAEAPGDGTTEAVAT